MSGLYEVVDFVLLSSVAFLIIYMQKKWSTWSKYPGTTDGRYDYIAGNLSVTTGRDSAPSMLAGLAKLTTVSTGWGIFKKTPRWFAEELLKRADVTSGEICLFHLGMFPVLDEQAIRIGLQLILDEPTITQQGAPAYMQNARQANRNLITRIQFSRYQFDYLPRVFDRSYPNLLHLDIRQNALLTSIDSIISHLPNLTSLMISECPNLRTITPLATSRTQPGIDGEFDELPQLNLTHLWVSGCNLSSMSREDWGQIFDYLAVWSPIKLLMLNRNRLSFLHKNIGKLKSLEDLFVEDNNFSTLPDELGNLSQLRFISLCGNNLKRLPRTFGRFDESCDVYLQRNHNLSYPPSEYQRSSKKIREFFHIERMKLLRGLILFMPHHKRARLRAIDNLYRPGGSGYIACRDRFGKMEKLR